MLMNEAALTRHAATRGTLAVMDAAAMSSAWKSDFGAAGFSGPAVIDDELVRSSSDLVPLLSWTSRRARNHLVQLLGIDLGTTTFKAVVYSEFGAVKAAAATPPVTTSATVAGSALDLWPAEALWSSICGIVREAVGQLEDTRIDGLAIAELGLVGLPVGAGGEALYPPVAWMNPPDPFADFERELIDEVAMFASTGNRLNPIYPPIWISWLRRHDDSYPASFWKWLNVGEYLSYRMTGEVAIDYSMASQTLLPRPAPSRVPHGPSRGDGTGGRRLPFAAQLRRGARTHQPEGGRRPRDRGRNAGHGRRGGFCDRLLRVRHGKPGRVSHHHRNLGVHCPLQRPARDSMVDSRGRWDL